MRFIDRLAFVLGAKVKLDDAKAASVNYPPWVLEGITPWTDQPDLDVTKNQLALMQRLSWVYNAVTIRAQTAAGTPFSVKKRAGEDEEDIKNHPFELLLEKPNPLQSRFEFLEALFGFRALSGNAYIWLNRTSADAAPSEMWLMPPNRMKPVPDKNLFLKGYSYDPGEGSREIPLETWEVCHLKRWHPLNRYVGLSPIEALAQAVEGDIAMQKWNKNYFSKHNAKIPGILAFADPVQDTDWEKVKASIREEHGGTERRIMLLRNAGAGGVQWMSTGIPQKDMEFLEGRNFSKEEIYAAFAPGLASVLAINATEANSTAGKSTFMDMTIWPDHTAVAEKFSNDILPAYGDNLRGEFEDVRIPDRAIALQEQQAYGLVHTVDEVRAEFYQDKPLDDEEKGRLLVPEVGKGSTSTGGAADVGVNPPGRMPPQLAPFARAAQENAGPQPQDVTPSDAQMKVDLQAWERFAAKRVKDGKALRQFESNEIPEALKGAVEGALISATTAADVHEIFRDALNWKSYP